MKKFTVILAALISLTLTDYNNVGASVVTVENRQLKVDGQPFFVKGVGYDPTPIGKFIGRGEGWSATCEYLGPNPPLYPDKRFNHGEHSPDGVGNYSCSDNGTSYVDDVNILDRDFKIMKDMNVNTVRTWGNVSSQFLTKANEYGLKVMAGYWISYNIDFTFPGADGPAARQTLIDDFVTYVDTFKDDPAILMWGLSNENNIAFCNYSCPAPVGCDRNAQAIGFYKLIRDMALAGQAVETTNTHPFIMVSAEFTDDLKTHGHHMFTDDGGSEITGLPIIFGINAYRGDDFDGWPPGNPNLFDDFDAIFPNKSLIIAEFGTDAWNTNGFDSNPENGFEDQVGQSAYVTAAWQEIADHSVPQGGPSNGGVVFNYSDQWNMHAELPIAPEVPDPQCPYISSDWTPSVVVHDYGIYDPNIFGPGTGPDDRVNMEWWGITSIEENPDGSMCDTPAGVDCIHLRDVYFSLQEKFNAESFSIEPIAQQVVDEGEMIAFDVSANNHDSLALTFSAQNLPGGAVLTPLGDVNLSGDLSSADAAMLSDHLNGSISLSDIQMAVSDIDQDGSLSQSDVDMIMGLLLNPPTHQDPYTYRFVWTPDYDQAGNYDEIIFHVQSDNNTDSEGIAIIVNNVNRPPTLDPIPDKTVRKSVLGTGPYGQDARSWVLLSATDPDLGDEDSLDYTVDSETFPDSKEGIIEDGYYKPPGNLRKGERGKVTIRVTDPNEEYDTESFIFRVRKRGHRPRIGR